MNQLLTHPLLSLLECKATGLKSMLTHYIDATVDSQFASLRNSFETMIQSGVIGPNSDGTHFGTTLPQPTHTNTHQSSDECSHEYSYDTLTRAQRHQNNLQNEANTINTEPMIKREFDDDENDEDGEKIDDDSMMIHENINCSSSLSPSNDSIKSEIDSDCEENVTDHNNLPGESQFDQSKEAENDHLTNTQDHNNLQNDVSLCNTINTESMIKQEFDDEEEDGEEFDDDNVRKCENGICFSGDDTELGQNEDESSDTTQHDFLAALENNQTNPLIISNDISPSPTNPINIQPLIKQQCLQGSAITSIPLNVNRNAELNDISIDEQIEGQNTQIENDEFDDNLNNNDGENENLINNLNCANGVNNVPFRENNNHSIDDMFSGDGDKVDIETNLDEAQFDIDISVTNNTQMSNQNDEQNDINERSVSERNMERSTPSTSGVRSSTRKRIQTKAFGDLVQSNVIHRKSAKRKSDQSNKSEKKVKLKYVLDNDEVTDDIDDQEDHAIRNEIATECTTNPIQPNLAQPNRNLHCSHCHKSFVAKSEFTKHLRVHTGERSFKCDQCGKRFSMKSNLTQHQLIHQNIKRFQCDQCDKQFNHKVTLNNHLLVHSGERPHQCRFCDKSFAQFNSRNKHEQAIHLHVKPYRCKLCGHTATQRVHVITHIRVVHFGLPPTIKQQQTLNIIDHRDAREYVEKV